MNLFPRVFRLSIARSILLALLGVISAPLAVLAGSVTLSPSSSGFDIFVLGTSSPARKATLANGTAAAVSISGITISGDFHLAGMTCGTTLAAGLSCTINVTFTPTAIGTRTGTLNVNLPGIGTLADNLSGTGTAVSIAPRPLNFGNVAVKFISILNVVLTNVASSPVLFTGASISGANRADFSISANYCVNSLAPQQSCKIYIQVVPSLLAKETALLTVSDNGGGNTQAVYLNVVGVNPAPLITNLSPSNTLFGGVGFTLTVSGWYFVPSSVVRWNGSNRQTTFVNGNTITASILASDIAAPGLAPITVFTPAPGGGSSSVWSFTVNPSPVPAISGLSPANATFGGSGFILSVSGFSFVPSSVVQWNGSARPTTFFNSNLLQSSISAADIAAAGPAQVTVFTPFPGGGTSFAWTFTVSGNPPPSLSSVFPGSQPPGGSAFTLIALGTNFVPSSVVQWNGSGRQTTFVNSGQLNASILASDIALAGTAQITVITPAPGGGTSGSVGFQIVLPNPVPSITSISPTSVPAGGPDFTLTVNGAGFVPGSHIVWINHTVTTTVVSASLLQALIPAFDISTIGSASVFVFTPAPGGGFSSTMPFTISLPPGVTILNLTANDLIWDPYSRLIYASVPSSAGANGNTVTEIDPYAGTIGTSTFVGSEPTRLAVSDDGQFLYVGLNGSKSVERLRIPNVTPDLNVSLGSDPFFGPFVALYLEALPGAPHSFAVTRATPGYSPEESGVAVFDDAVQRPNLVGAGKFPIVDSLQFGSSASTLYGYDNEDSGFTFYRLSVDSKGVTIAQQANNLIGGYRYNIHFDNGLIYSDSGQVLDPATFSNVGSFPVIGELGAPDSTLGRVFFAPTGYAFSSGPPIFTAFDQTHFTPVGTLSIPLPYATGYSIFFGSYIRWGQSGLAFRTYNDGGQPGQVILINSPFVLPASATNNPVPTASTLSPASATTGTGNFQITVNGSNFVLGATVQWNGQDRTTKFISSTQLIAYIPASDIAAAGTPQVTVVNPAPAGGSSVALTFTLAP